MTKIIGYTDDGIPIVDPRDFPADSEYLEYLKNHPNCAVGYLRRLRVTDPSGKPLYEIPARTIEGEPLSGTNNTVCGPYTETEPAPYHPIGNNLNPPVTPNMGLGADAAGEWINSHTSVLISFSLEEIQELKQMVQERRAGNAVSCATQALCDPPIRGNVPIGRGAMRPLRSSNVLTYDDPLPGNVTSFPILDAWGYSLGSVDYHTDPETGEVRATRHVPEQQGDEMTENAENVSAGGPEAGYAVNTGLAGRTVRATALTITIHPAGKLTRFQAETFAIKFLADHKLDYGYDAVAERVDDDWVIRLTLV